MNAKQTRRRVLAAGMAIQLFGGIPAAWGVFQRPVCETFGLSAAGASFLFALLVAAFGAGCIPGGFLQDAKGPRAAGLWGAAITAAGFALSALVPQRAGWLLAFTLSLPVGCGCAFLYPAVMSCAQKQYADKKGFATGMIGIAVGLSGGFLTLTGRTLQRYAGLRGCFLGFGGLFLAVCLPAALALADPPDAKKAPAGKNDHTPLQMLRTRDWRLLFAAGALGTPSVLLFSPIILEWGEGRGLSAGAALCSIIFGSMASAAGRLSMPALSDRVGRLRVDRWLFLALSAFSVIFIFAGGWWVVACWAALCFCYSGECALLPAICTDRFGLRHAGINYGFLALGQSAGSLLFGPPAGALPFLWPRHALAVLAPLLGAGLLLRLEKGED